MLKLLRKKNWLTLKRMTDKYRLYILFISQMLFFTFAIHSWKCHKIPTLTHPPGNIASKLFYFVCQIQTNKNSTKTKQNDVQETNCVSFHLCKYLIFLNLMWFSDCLWNNFKRNWQFSLYSIKISKILQSFSGSIFQRKNHIML